MIDLHVHSNRSDGTFSPAELVDYAIEKGISLFALTDHDTMEGVTEAQEAAAGRNIRVIPGIELSTDYKGHDIHVVGLDVDPENPPFKAHVINFAASRVNRNRRMCQKLHDIAGIDISYEKLEEEYPGAVITRANYARYLLKYGYVKTMKEAFSRYIGSDCPCYVPREKTSPFEAVELIISAGGIPVLAHPLLYHLGEAALDTLVGEMCKHGLAALEALYSTYSPADERDMRALADKHNLLLSGGSDFHGSNKPTIDLGTGRGSLHIDEEVWDKLLEWKRNG